MPISINYHGQLITFIVHQTNNITITSWIELPNEKKKTDKMVVVVVIFHPCGTLTVSIDLLTLMAVGGGGITGVEEREGGVKGLFRTRKGESDKNNNRNKRMYVKNEKFCRPMTQA